MILHLIRHPRPLIAPGICYGQLDIPAENPLSVAAELRRNLPADVPLWSSPLQRCRQLAELLHPAPCFDERLMEMNFGDWEGRPWEDVPRQQLDDWAADLLDYAPPGGEPASGVRQRLLDFLQEHFCPEMVLVTHAGLIRILFAEYKKQPLAACVGYPVAYGQIVKLTY